ncbi:Nop domain-containing protein [Lentithecium fluviatile CBS 122367]|uniref:Nucleolar protein 58 n=1 Tax=Lentithecium fluviatile CBS 122367 TaxID=1168545 RepID=A0A6G1IY74_9PLEO|nr:Nop domain-containing protein [Lentithecium fluviatile CBS 122367]
MGLFILTETSAGYALFKAHNKKLLKDGDKDLSSVEGAVNALKLKKFTKFENAVTALNEAAALSESKVSSTLSNLLNELKNETKASLAVADPKLGTAVAQIPGLSLKVVTDSSTQDVYRAIREHLPSLIPDLIPAEIDSTRLGLSHSLSRHKLKFSPDKVDTMIIQSIGSLDVLDKQLNTYAMRVKEWYGWHFPELAKILNDNLAYSRVVLKLGFRSNARTADLSAILPEEIELAVKAAADISMGTEISDEDLETIGALATEVVELTEHRQNLGTYLSTRMQALAPNLTALVGELVGARLIAHAGSLMNLAKSPGSTIQILGAEKALFRALKTKHDTPKYGLIYHASLIGQATGKNKGKIARMLAAKSALGLRVDALSTWGVASEDSAKEPSEEKKSEIGRTARLGIERRLRALEGKPLKSLPNANATPLAPAKWEVKEARKYNPDADGLTGDEPAAKKTKTQVNGTPKKLVQEVSSDNEDEDVTMGDVDAGAEDSDSDSDSEPAKAVKTDSKAAKKAEKEAKKARKAERAAKREAKAAKKAAKEAKKAEKESKKRKADDEGDKGEKKKKKKSKA